MIGGGWLLTLGLAALPTSPSTLYSVLLLYTCSPILPSAFFNGPGGLRTDCVFALGCS
jgi:hypothetical protein